MCMHTCMIYHHHYCHRYYHHNDHHHQDQSRKHFTHAHYDCSFFQTSNRVILLTTPTENHEIFTKCKKIMKFSVQCFSEDDSE